MPDILIKSKIRNYHVKFLSNFNLLKKQIIGKDTFLAVDKEILHLYNRELFANANSSNLLILEAKEKTKTLPSAIKIYKFLLTREVTRKSTIVAIGGGVIQDVIGFVASTLYRGINWIYVPTTLLAQADSCIGAKTSLNFANTKNVIGTFYPPATVYINLQFLRTIKR